MQIEFFNRGLLQIIEAQNIKEEEVSKVQIGESSIILTLKDGRRYVTHYTLTDEFYPIMSVDPEN
jgi:hypothetical protein